MYTWLHVHDCTKDQDQEKTMIPRVTDEGWNSQKQLSGPCSGAERERKEKTPVSSSKALSRFSSL